MKFFEAFNIALLIVFFVFILVLPISIIAKTSGVLIIYQDYYDEYLEVKQELDKLNEAREFKCQPVECKQGAIGYIFTFLGFIIYILSLLFHWKITKKLDKRESELKEREKML